MKIKFAIIAVLFGAAPAFAGGQALRQLPGGPVAEVKVPLASAPEDARLERLRAEAAADPAAFLDEHTPEEIGLAFGLRPDRYVVTDKERIERAAVKLTVDLSKQRLTVKSAAGVKVYKISSGLPPQNTTPGSGKCFAPDFMETMHYSSLYNNAPMPHSIFFNGNIAVHATMAEHLLGKPASHGCIRLSRADAKTVFGAVKAAGKANAVICVTGKTPGTKDAGL